MSSALQAFGLRPAFHPSGLDRAQRDESRQAPEEKFVSAQERRKMWSDEWLSLIHI